LSSDEALLFSLDIPHDGVRDLYRIKSEGGSFKLESDKKRICGGGGAKPNLAITIAPQGIHDHILVLRKDGLYAFLE
jgi:hypothetical protein